MKNTLARLFASLCLLLSPSTPAEPTPSGQAMQQLAGLPYQLYATQAQTERRQALNCTSAVIDALRRSGYACPGLTFHQAYAWWQPQAAILQPGKTPFPPGGALLLTREHFLLLHEDTNRDGLIDGDDLIVHAYYRPVTVEPLARWRQNSPLHPLYVIPLGQQFFCPDAAQAGLLPKGRRSVRNASPNDLMRP